MANAKLLKGNRQSESIGYGQEKTDIGGKLRFEKSSERRMARKFQKFNRNVSSSLHRIIFFIFKNDNSFRNVVPVDK